jgi:hypothetical protein
VLGGCLAGLLPSLDCDRQSYGPPAKGLQPTGLAPIEAGMCQQNPDSANYQADETDRVNPMRKSDEKTMPEKLSRVEF